MAKDLNSDMWYQVPEKNKYKTKDSMEDIVKDLEKQRKKQSKPEDKWYDVPGKKKYPSMKEILEGKINEEDDPRIPKVGEWDDSGGVKAGPSRHGRRDPEVQGYYRKPTQKFQKGAKVNIGFSKDLEVIGKKKNVYLLTKNNKYYTFEPHVGLQQVDKPQQISQQPVQVSDEDIVGKLECLNMKKLYKKALKEAKLELSSEQKRAAQQIEKRFNVSILPNKMMQIFDKTNNKKALYNFETEQLKFGNVDPAQAREIIMTIKEYNLQLYFSQDAGMREASLKPATISEKDVDSNELKMGVAVEHEHTDDEKIAKTIALQHLAEDPKYYTKLKKMESGFKNKK